MPPPPRQSSSPSTNRISRRTFLAQTSAALTATAFSSVVPAWAQPQTPPDFQLEIAPLALEIAPKKIIHTIAYNGRVPGPLIRWPEGKPIIIDVRNRSAVPEIIHWHGLHIPSSMDGAAEEGSPLIPPGAQFRYSFAPRPSGFRWYHTHTFAGHDLKRAAYTGQFGCFYIEPKSDPAALSQKFDQEIFLTLHDWNAYMAPSGDSSSEAAYDYSTINGRMLGHADPLRVREGQRILLHILNASASMMHWLALAGHQLTVIAMDGNPVPTPRAMPAIRLAPAERIDALVTMNNPGVWILAETREPFRKAGMGIVVEYANRQEKPKWPRPKWIDPPETLWDYSLFANSQPPAAVPGEIIPLRFESKFNGAGTFDTWLINGKSFPHTDTPLLHEGKRYRLRMTNRSADDHPMHLHRHTFEAVNIAGAPLSGLLKDVLVVPANSTADIDFTADNPGPTLFHCHMQSHMDFGFMMLFRYT